MGLLDLFGKKDASEVISGKPYSITTKLVPYRLTKTGSVELYITVKNLMHEVALTSVVIELPSSLGFDKAGLTTTREIRVGQLGPGEEKTIRSTIYGNHKTHGGEYTVTITAIVHYHDYAHVLNSLKKKILLRVIE